MSNSLVTQDAAQYTAEQRQLITDVLCKGASPIEVEFFMQVSQRCKLDPFRRQIHAVKRWDSQANREVMTFQVGIDGLRAIAARTKEYAGNDDPVFIVEGNNWYPTKATVTVYRMVHGQRIPFTASVFWAEYVQTKRDGAVTSMWRQRPFGQLGKCAEAAALRKAFPEDTSGLYTEEEIRDDREFAQPAPVQEPPVYAEVSVRKPEPIKPPVVEAEVTQAPLEPTEEQNAPFYDLLDVICDTSTTHDLNQQIGEVEKLSFDSQKSAAKKAINKKAKELGLTWNAESHKFINPPAKA